MANCQRDERPCRSYRLARLGDSVPRALLRIYSDGPLEVNAADLAQANLTFLVGIRVDGLRAGMLSIPFRVLRDLRIAVPSFHFCRRSKRGSGTRSELARRRPQIGGRVAAGRDLPGRWCHSN